MTIYYVDSAAGSNTSPFDTWAKAATTLQAAATLAVGGDTIYVASSHAETGSSALTITFGGSTSSLVNVICTDKLATPPLSANLVPASGSTTPGGGATITTTTAAAIVVVGFVYMRGITFNAASGASAGSITLGNVAGNQQFYELCKFSLVGTATTSRITTASVVLFTDLLNCSVKFANASQGFTVQIGSGAGIRWRGGGIDAASTVPTNIFTGSSNRSNCFIGEDLDLSLLGSGKTLFGNSGTSCGSRWQLSRCKLGASVGIIGTVGNYSCVVDIINCDSGATNYRNERYDFCGVLTTDTVDIRSGGATDGTTPIAHKIVTNANASVRQPFEVFDIVQWWGSGLGSSHTVSIPIMSNATLTNADIWPEVEFLGSSSFPIGTVNSGGLADPLASSSNWATDGVSSWTTTGVSGPIQQTLSVSFTPQQAGYVRVRIKVAKASQTLRIDPLLQIV